MPRGFTLTELLIVVALIFILSTLTLPVGFEFYQESALREQIKNLENSLRKTQAMALTGRAESSAGVKIEEKQYIIFTGESFEECRIEAIIPFPIALLISGDDEVVFQKLSGLPVPEESEIILEFGALSAKITINAQGKIERHEPTRK